MDNYNTELCEYGCGQKAQYTLKNGKICCSKSPNSCPERRRINSISKKGKNPWENKEHPRGKTGKKSWNSGKKYEDVLGVEKAEEYKNKISESNKNNPKVTGRASSNILEKIRKQKIRDNMINNPNAGGYRKGSGRGKKGWYKGYWCDSSYELAFVIYNLDHKISFERNHKAFEYIFENKKLKYYPDFIVDGRYIEIKAYIDEKTQAKIDQFPYDLEVLIGDTIEPYIIYAKETYGKDYVYLYE